MTLRFCDPIDGTGDVSTARRMGAAPFLQFLCFVVCLFSSCFDSDCSSSSSVAGQSLLDDEEDDPGTDSCVRSGDGFGIGFEISFFFF